MVFIPTTWNPSDLAGETLSNGNLTATCSASGGVRGISGITTGTKCYFELRVSPWSSVGNTAVGIGTGTGTPGSPTNFAYLTQGGGINVNGSNAGNIGSRSAGDTIGVALDLVNNMIWFRVAPSGNWNGSGTANPATNTGGFSVSSLALPLYPSFQCNNVGDACTADFGASAFSGTVPSGFTAGVGAQVTTATLSYDYESIDGAPTAGKAQQGVTNPALLTISYTGQGATNNTTFLQALNNTYTITCNSLKWTISSVTQQASAAVVTINPPEVALPYGVTNLVFSPLPAAELPTFPAFTPIIPTSTFPPGGGVGSIGDPIGVPTFPPPTPPPIGSVPAGPLVGPAVAAAAVPPSVAGVVQPQYQTGSATSPTAASWFPQFTTTGAYAGFPNQPPTGVPIVFANIWTNPSHSSVNITAATWATGQTTYTTASAHGIPVGTVVQITGCTPATFNGTFVTVTGTTGSTLVVSATTSPGTFVSGGSLGSTATWTVVTPPSTPTTAQIILNGWGLPGPSGVGPGPPTYPNPPGAGLPHLAEASSNIDMTPPPAPAAPEYLLYAGTGRRKRKFNQPNV